MFEHDSPQPPRILLATGDADHDGVLVSVLMSAGMDVVSARAGQEVLTILQRPLQVDLLLLTATVTAPDAWTVCAQARALLGGAAWPIVFVLPGDDQGGMRRALAAGATEFVAPPCDDPAVPYRLRGLIDHHRRLARDSHRLALTKRLARLGHWEYAPRHGTVHWSLPSRQLIAGGTKVPDENGLDFLLARVPAAERAQVADWFAALDQLTAPVELTHRVRDASGTQRYLRQFAMPAEHESEAAQPPLVHGMVQDISTLIAAERQIHRLAYFDSLTGLPNRAFFMQQLDKTLKLAARHQRTGALLFLDLDNFKKVNDTLGHHSGDLLLKGVAERMINSLRTTDVIGLRVPENDSEDIHYLARLGGDEFTILLPELRLSSDAARVALRILEALGKPFALDGNEVVVTPSVGITVFPQDGLEVSDLLRNGDMAMYHAKHAGKNTYKFYDPSLNEAAVRRLRLENALRQAIRNNELELHFQPQIDAGSGEIHGVEALLRWRNPEFGLVSPLEFLPIAEETGLVLAIGEWVLVSACRQLRAWRDAGHPIERVAVNISASQFKSNDFPAQVARILAETGLPPAALELELTETILMTRAEESVHTLAALKAIGVQLAIDDFGVGYSSLSYLKRFAIDRLKIDKSFMCDIENDCGNAAVAQAVIAMAASMSLHVTAEGVETDRQLAFLRDRACGEVQGFLFGQPMPASDVPALFQHPCATARPYAAHAGSPS